MDKSSLIPNSRQVPLSAETLKKGRNTLLLSLIAIAMVRMNLVPTKIEGFGLAFDKTTPKALLAVLLVAVLYSILGFVLYGYKDALENRLWFHLERKEEHAAQQGRAATGHLITDSAVQYYKDKIERHPAFKPLFICGIIYEVAFPIFASVWATIELLARMKQKLTKTLL